ncbi:LamG-like jellyroll fold domain-containing protein [Nonomuraea sp. ZG12]|uniref:LamG-like jellyroll fold domain-containing protein n=1 Tax=Nonomuraea sp. ZG12 TaxID=3452207 RepID=UPI003F89E706
MADDQETVVAVGSHGTRHFAVLTDGWKIRWRARAVNTGATTTSAWSDWLAATVDVPDPGGQPTVTALQIDPSQQVNGQTVTTSLTPALLAQVTDPAGQPLRVEYEVEHDPAATEQGTGQIWTGALDNIASGAPARITVAEGRLQDGWKARWRTRALNTAAGTSSAWSDWQEFQVSVIEPTDDALAYTAGALIPTDGNFTVTAWLRWDDKDGAYTVVEQKGLHQAPFHLGNTPEDGLVFTFTSADSPDATTEGVRSQVEPPVNEWFHLAGVYDAASKKATLYLNGAAIKSETISFPAWRATGFTTLGTRMSGALDDVRIYDKAITADEAVISAGGTPQPTTAPSTKSERATTAASGLVAAPAYNRIQPADCIARNDSFYRPATTRVPPKNERGWTPGPHDWCVSQKPKFTVEVKTKLGWQVTDQAEFVLMTIGRTANDSRTTEIDVITLAMNDAVKGVLLRDQVFTLGLMVQGSPANSCRQVVDANHPQVFAGNRHYWQNSRKVTFKVESPETGWSGGGNNLLSECTIQLSLTVPHVQGMMYKNRSAKALIRCDSSTENRYFPRGCIFDHNMRALELHENTFPNAYAHISKAYLTPNITTPSTSTTDRKLWPRHLAFGTEKKFPGFSPATPLTRLKAGPRKGRNYYRSFKICAFDYGIRTGNPYTGGAAPWDTDKQECDEFPFQSTYQGSWVSWQKDKPTDKGAPYMPGVAISVSLIPKQENRDWGDVHHIAGLGRFYQNDRILHDEDFILHLYNAMNERIN